MEAGLPVEVIWWKCLRSSHQRGITESVERIIDGTHHESISVDEDESFELSECPCCELGAGQAPSLSHVRGMEE